MLTVVAERVCCYFMLNDNAFPFGPTDISTHHGKGLKPRLGVETKKSARDCARDCFMCGRDVIAALFFGGNNLKNTLQMSMRAYVARV